MTRLTLIFIISFIITLISIYNTPYDDTDDAANSERSNMQLFTDNLTGCQYLKASYFAALTKRVDGTGRHVGCK